MSQEIPADAVPFQDEERGTSGRYCRSLDTNIISEPMGESSDSCDSFEARGSSSRTEQQQKSVQNQIVIQNPRGPIHLGPVYNLNIGQAFTQVNSRQQHTVHQTSPSPGEDRQPQSPVMDNEREVPPKEELRTLYYSKRVIELEELPRLSQNIGANWKAVGNGLKFNWAQLEQFEADTKSMSEAVQRMLFRWLQWKDQKATVGRLTKVLFNHKEFDAIRCLNP